MKPTRLEVSHLAKDYGLRKILKDISLYIDKGEVIGLLGPNGAGKSTTFNILTSLIPKSFGNVKIKNIEVNKGIMEIY